MFSLTRKMMTDSASLTRNHMGVVLCSNCIKHCVTDSTNGNNISVTEENYTEFMSHHDNLEIKNRIDANYKDGYVPSSRVIKSMRDLPFNKLVESLAILVYLPGKHR